MASGSLQLAAYLRVAAYAIAFSSAYLCLHERRHQAEFMHSYLQTLPAEYRLYARQKGPFNLSIACILFIVVRYVGLATLIISNTGFFYHGFSEAACDRYFWLAPVFKLILYMTSQLILGLRTYAVSRQSRLVLFVLNILFIVCCVPEFISTFWKRVHQGACVGVGDEGQFTGVLTLTGKLQFGKPAGSPHCRVLLRRCLLYDLVTMTITSAYLWKFSSSSRSSWSQLARMMLEDGLMYFLALSAMNTVNIIFFQNPETVLQSSAVSLGFASTMIFSGRFILNLAEHVRDGVSGDQGHSSRTPRTPMASGFRPQNTVTGSSDSPLVVSVMRNVITMDDIGKERDPESATKHRSHWA
ncbi:hypothetical protein B0H13DRAFT_2353807 [Mycena leptocephala]|nr:hypothetical protein B0H13DRAFT_2353807 [Mycena leptocephala]